MLRMVSVLDWRVNGETLGGSCTDGTTELINLGFERIAPVVPECALRTAPGLVRADVPMPTVEGNP
ncbi:hypothetical protein ACFVWG_22190 [Kribbella sp. NPDC058245]|uniref:hypothetical protein n=1 Tax=Kribbella sp. NPDC058245 TaxID=3346399 RepID=UPI0036E5C347